MEIQSSEPSTHWHLPFQNWKIMQDLPQISSVGIRSIVAYLDLLHFCVLYRAFFKTKLRDDSFEYHIEWIITSLLVGGSTNPSERICSSSWIIFPNVSGWVNTKTPHKPQNSPTLTAGFCIWCWNSSQFNVPGGLNNGFNGFNVPLQLEFLPLYI